MSRGYSVDVVDASCVFRRPYRVATNKGTKPTVATPVVVVKRECITGVGLLTWCTADTVGCSQLMKVSVNVKGI